MSNRFVVLCSKRLGRKDGKIAFAKFKSGKLGKKNLLFYCLLPCHNFIL